MTYQTIQHLMEIERIDVDKKDIGHLMAYGITSVGITLDKMNGDRDHFTKEQVNKWVNSLPTLVPGYKYYVDTKSLAATIVVPLDKDPYEWDDSHDVARYVVVGGVNFTDKRHAWQVGSAGVVSAHQGKQLIVKLYATLVTKNKLTLMSGDEQSEGGTKTWMALSKMPGVFVYAWDTAKRTAYHAFDDDDAITFDTSVGHVHDDPEMDRARNKASYSVSTKLTKLEGKLDAYLGKGNANPAMVAKLEAQIEELRKIEDELEADADEGGEYGNMVLIATRGKTSVDL